MNDALYSAAEIRGIEAAHAKKKPKESLMLLAGAAVATLAGKIVAKKRGAHILVIAGPGNNGGDAWVAASLLKKAGQRITLLAPLEQRHVDPVAKSAMAAFRKAHGTVVATYPADDKFDLIIDGLFGIGLQRAAEGDLEELITRTNENASRNHTPILAIDVPSGLSADTGVAIGATIQADFTLTFLGAKPGLYTADGADYAGEVHVETLNVVTAAAQGELLRRNPIAALIPKRVNNSHKGSYGIVGIIGGAAGMIGAAVLAARAALHMGPGKVLLGLAAKDAPLYDSINPEIMLRAADELINDPSLSSLAIGMGLGTDKTAPRLLKTAVMRSLPMVIDADALTIISTNPSIVAALQAKSSGKPHQCLNIVFTPHAGEAARLLAVATTDIQFDRVKAARSIAANYNVVTVLKGAGSVIATPDGRYWINVTGNSGMASGGMGDALSGMIASFLAQGMNALDAARLSVFLHGAAADECLANRMAPHGLTASEVIFEARSLLNSTLASSDHEHGDEQDHPS